MAYTEAELVSQLQACYEKHGKITYNLFNSDEEFCSAPTIQNNFESWNKGLEAAGLGVNQAWRTYTEEDLLGQIQQCEEKHGEVTAPIFREDDEFTSPKTVSRIVGSWKKGLKLAGCYQPSKYHVDYTDSELLEQLCECFDRYGKVTEEIFNNDPETSYGATIERHFGSFSQGVEEAGLEPYVHPTGEDHPTYIDGSTADYGSNWAEMRDARRDRDGACQACGVEEDPIGRKLPVHHIKRRGAFVSSPLFSVEDSNTLDNLVTLCSRCHPRVDAGIIECPPPGVQASDLKPRVI